MAIQRDREVAIWHQLQIDQELADEEMARHYQDQDRHHSDENENSASEHFPHEVTQPPHEKPSVDRTSKPDTSPAKGSHGGPVIPSRASKPASSSLYSSGGLRTVKVPTMLMAKFLSLSDLNTKANVETCGILAGKLAQNAFKITHLLIPKQTGMKPFLRISGSCTIT